MLARIMNDVRPLRRLGCDWDGALADLFGRVGGGDLIDGFGPRAFPAVNVWEDEQAVHVEAELPGWAMDEVEVTVLGDELTISGERKSTAKEEPDYLRRESGVASFRRDLRFPAVVDPAKVKATLSQGILAITMPKADAHKPRRITVKTN
ncbi:MAG: Hsp20/alpha crystallin family protein [Phycisphaerae bacterium]